MDVTMPRTTHRETSPDTHHLPSERAEQIGRRIAIAIVSRNWDRCRAIIGEAEAEAARSPQPIDMAVAELLPPRLANGLESMGVLMVRDLLELLPADILGQQNFGPGALRDIRRGLRAAGLGNVKSVLRPG
jgi:hypothetical protein